MKKYLVGLLVAVMLVILTPAPANAGWGGFIKHYSPDRGYDAAIIVRCDYGNPDSKRYVKEGERSSKYCPDVDQIYVRYNEEIVCKYVYPTHTVWEKKFDARGWHKINNFWNDGVGCVVTRD